MLVILHKKVPNLGNVGDVVKVKDGYGRNYLVPRGMAVIADQSNRRRMAHQQREADAQRAKTKAEAEALAAKVAETPITIKAKVGEEGKLFGSVTNRDIVETLAERVSSSTVPCRWAMPLSQRVPSISRSSWAWMLRRH